MSVIGYVERLDAGSGFVIVRGWLKGTQGEFESPDLRLTLSSDAKAVAGARITALYEREDLPPEGETIGRGFGAILRTDHDVRAAAFGLSIAAAGVSSDLPSSGEIRESVPLGHIDSIDETDIAGWVFDPGALIRKRKPVLLVGGVHPVELDLTAPRRDLKCDDGAGGVNFGFRVSLADVARLARGSAPDLSLFDGQEHGLALMSSGQELDFGVLQQDARVNGRLERFAKGVVSGWAVAKAAPGVPTSVEILVDGTRFHTIRATVERDDLKRKGLATKGGGFRFELFHESPSEAGAVNVTVRAAHGIADLNGGPILVDGLKRRQKDHAHLASVLPEAGTAPAAIIVPIYNAADDVALCIEAVVRNTTSPARLLLIDDASPDPRIGEILARWEGWPGIEIHRNETNLGFTKTVNRGIALAGTDDVVFLNSDTMVFPGWLEGLRVTAYSDRTAGTATALSNNAGAFSVPEFGVPNSFPLAFEGEDMARLVRQVSLGLMPSVPTGNGFCMYVRRSCIDTIGPLDEIAFPRGYGEENDFCMRAVRAGLLNLVDDRTLVYHRRSASFGEEKGALYEAGRKIIGERYPEYSRLTSVYSNDLDFLAIRWRVRRAVAAAQVTGTTPRPRVLFVISTQTGGTPQTNRDLMGALSDRYEPWVLRCDSRLVELTRYEAEQSVVVETHRLDRPISMSAHHSTEYDGRVADLLFRHAFELVHIRHIAWHSLGLTDVCRRLGIPVVVSFHDYYCVCPTIKLLDENRIYCGGHCTATDGECKAELWPAADVPPLKHRFVNRWKELMGSALQHSDAFVTTSPGARQTILDNYPQFAGIDFRVIQHGRDFAKMEALAPAPSIDEPLRILVPGNISMAKGGDLFKDLAELDVDEELEFHILGDAGTVPASRAIVLHGRYSREDFVDHVGRIRPHIGAVLSIWPETYCHTLTEMWACGVPVMAFDMGAVGERIAAHGGGWLLDRWTTPEQLFETLLRVKRDLKGIRSKVGEVIDWQEGFGRHYETKAMAVEYDLLYREIFQRRRVFANPAREAHLRPGKVLVLAKEASASGKASRSTQRRVAELTRNRASRSLVFRTVTSSYPWDDPVIGRADALLLRPQAIKPFDTIDLLRRCRAGGIPVIVDLDEPVVGPAPDAPPPRTIDRAAALLDVLRAARLTLAATRPVLDSIAFVAQRAVLSPDALSGRLWATDPPPSVTPARGHKAQRLKLLYISTDTEVEDLAMVKPAIEALHAEGICELHVVTDRVVPPWAERIDPPDPGLDYPDFVRWLRQLARGYDIAISPMGEAGLPRSKTAETLVELAATGLVVVTSSLRKLLDPEVERYAVLVGHDDQGLTDTLRRFQSSPDARAAAARAGWRHAMADRLSLGGAGGYDAALQAAFTATSEGAVLAPEATVVTIAKPAEGEVLEVAGAQPV